MKSKYTVLAVLAFFVILVLCFFGDRVWSLFAPIFYALVLTYIANPFVNRCSKRLPRKLGAVLFYVMALAVIALLIWGIFPALLRSVSSMIDVLPDILDDCREMLSGRYEEAIGYVSKSLGEQLKSTARGLIGFLGNAFSFFGNLIIAVVLSFFFLMDTEKLKEGFLSVLPSAWHREAIMTAREINVVLSNFIRGQLIVALILTVMMSVALWLLGVDYPLILGIIAGVLDIIPNFGAVLASIPILIVAYLVSPMKALWTLVVILVVQLIENNFISPKINADSVGISPASAIVSIYICAKLFGFWGILFGVPLFAVMKIIFRRMMATVV